MPLCAIALALAHCFHCLCTCVCNCTCTLMYMHCTSVCSYAYTGAVDVFAIVLAHTQRAIRPKCEITAKSNQMQDNCQRPHNGHKNPKLFNCHRNYTTQKDQVVLATISHFASIAQYLCTHAIANTSTAPMQPL